MYTNAPNQEVISTVLSLSISPRFEVFPGSVNDLWLWSYFVSPISAEYYVMSGDNLSDRWRVDVIRLPSSGT